jgi:hypothetical protein
MSFGHNDVRLVYIWGGKGMRFTVWFDHDTCHQIQVFQWGCLSLSEPWPMDARWYMPILMLENCWDNRDRNQCSSCPYRPCANHCRFNSRLISFSFLTSMYLWCWFLN